MNTHRQQRHTRTESNSPSAVFAQTVGADALLDDRAPLAHVRPRFPNRNTIHGDGNIERSDQTQNDPGMGTLWN
jgi:hypothetical protein